MYLIELSLIQFFLLYILLHAIHLYVIIFYRNCISYNLILLYYILYCIILYHLYFIQWNLIILFCPQPCYIKLYCMQFNCIVYHYAQLIVCNVIVLHLIVIIVGCIKFNRAYYLFNCVQFNLRLSYCRVAFFYVYLIACNIISCNLIVLCKIHLFALYGVFICSMIDYT